ncbi:hypothetical protein NDU88_004065 [Pleurodeles waltl]|uniref:Uncharacterized protein n=1 Tax=Pleurodeles waltl TaxID=8319 RepID=A0AAV7NRG2_PLEWA|nr:hypothetical protein NDU88_004065 [Pleurodeles waltl]
MSKGPGEWRAGIEEGQLSLGAPGWPGPPPGAVEGPVIIRASRWGLLQGRPGTGLKRDLDLVVGDLENPKRRPKQQRARDPKNGPYRYAEADGDRELEEACPGGLPDTQMRERIPQTQRVAAV